MSTVARPEQLKVIKRPSWTIVYDRDKNCVVNGNPGEWHLYATIQTIDGLGAFVLRELATTLLVKVNQDQHDLLALIAPESVSFFSFSRFGESSHRREATTGSEWLYTVFGYLLPDYRVYLTVLPSHTEYHCEPRTTPFLVV